MPRNHRRARRSLTALTASAAVAGAALVSLPAAQAATTNGTATSVVKADAYVEKEAPTRTTGASTKVVAAATSSMTKKALLRFEAPKLPAGAEVTGAELRISSSRNQPARVDVANLGSARWDEKTVTWRTAPAAKGSVTSIAPAARTKGFSVDVTGLVKEAADLNFAVTVPSGVSEILSKESGSATAPKLVVKYSVTTATPPPPARPTPPPPPPVTPTPPPPPVTPTPPPPAPAPATSGTLFGSNVFPVGQQSYVDALKGQDAKFGRMDATRVFYPGLPGSWSGAAGVSGRPVVVSFKAAPADIISGKLDAHFKDWFAKAPRDRQVSWTYFHEPEDNVERGEFTTAQFRAAFARLDRIADSVGNDQLKATPVLMCWTLNSRSGRNWKDYYPGDDVVDELGWDCYNLQADRGVFVSPTDLFGPVKKASESVGKPWGIAEFGSRMLANDPTGVGRGRWLDASAKWLRDNRASWVLYFDCTVGGDFRLLDASSIAAWRTAVAS
ncbi:DNRLRE domain-containing protein [uncultured Pseudokineococcus sp.]|uniref:DNRLRE domain-containing protein n=1 Tax=uncultured Pseudokineococcus sp. TaxID=1642928 RepID=UPI0026310FFC|nr:DNRLRE domain-containing protein [uncultured Pseudokineococcus sp.]